MISSFCDLYWYSFRTIVSGGKHFEFIWRIYITLFTGCHICGELGHKRRDCPHRLQEDKGNNRPHKRWGVHLFVNVCFMKSVDCELYSVLVVLSCLRFYLWDVVSQDDLVVSLGYLVFCLWWWNWHFRIVNVDREKVCPVCEVRCCCFMIQGKEKMWYILILVFYLKVRLVRFKCYLVNMLTVQYFSENHDNKEIILNGCHMHIIGIVKVWMTNSDLVHLKHFVSNHTWFCRLSKMSY